MCLFMGSDFVTLLVNIGYSLFFCTAYLRAVSVEGIPVGGYSVSQFVLMSCRVSITIVVVGIIIDAWLRVTVASELESSERRNTMESLLNVLCDAVVALNEEFVILQPAPKL